MQPIQLLVPQRQCRCALQMGRQTHGWLVTRGSRPQDQRLLQLEQQFQQLASRQSALETTVHDHHAQSTAQVQSLQQQMMVQLDMQSKQMQTMLTDQMSRIEHILAKKPRTE